jgi:hypothetical protein
MSISGIIWLIEENCAPSPREKTEDSMKGDMAVPSAVVPDSWEYM